MSFLDTALSVVAFLGFFAIVEYATYRIMEREHRKRDIYRLFFMLAWTTLAFVHMWLIAPLLNLPPTAAVGLGFALLFVFIAGGVGVPGLRTIADIGLYPFAQVYELFVVLLLLAEGVTLASSFVSVSQLSFLSNVSPNSPQIQAALGLGIAASFVALTFYDPRGENGYYYATGEYHQPSADYEKFREIMDDERTDPDNSETQVINSESSGKIADSTNPEASRAAVKALDNPDYEYNWTRSDIGFNDIGGYYDVKERLAEEVLQPARARARGDDRYDRFGIEPSRGILFHGPPGTGKTLFARALANALNRPFVELTQADLTHEHINKSPQLIKRLFEEAQHLGGVIFIDEAEQLLGDRTRSENAHAEDQKVTNMFLSALTQEDQDFILLLTTNQREGMDEAVLRPGRVDSEFEIGLPDIEARTKIIKLTVLGVPHKLTEGHAEHLAERTEGWSGADLDALANQAKLFAAERGASYLRWEDVKAAYKEVASDS